MIGCAAARELARRGLSVTVVERGTPSRGATWASAGMLSPLAEARQPGPFLSLALASLDRYPGFAEALHEATGIDVEYHDAGKLQIALDDQQTAELQATFAWRAEAGYPVEWLEGEEARRLEPALSSQVRGGVFIKRDHWVNNRRLGRALWTAAARAGVQFRLGDQVTGIVKEGGAGAARVAGVALAGGETLAAGRVLVAAGCWSGQLQGLPRPLPVFPVRGQMVALQSVPPALGRVVLVGTHYLIPRVSGRILVGATVECAGYRPHITPAGVGSLLATAMQTLPSLADAPLLELWAGLRPGTPDDMPILGADREVEGLFYATGHFRNGILLAPITAEVLADEMTGQASAFPLEAFSIGRFPSTGAR